MHHLSWKYYVIFVKIQNLNKMEEKQKLYEAFRTYDKLLKFVPAIIDNDITVDILKIAANEELQKIINLCQMSLGEEIMFKKVVKDLGGNIEPVSIGNKVKPASIITKSLVNMLPKFKNETFSNWSYYDDIYTNFREYFALNLQFKSLISSNRKPILLFYKT